VTAPNAEHTCLGSTTVQACAGCKETFDASPAGIVTQAVETLGTESTSEALANLLQILADEMSDEHAVEKEFPTHIPAARWQVVEWYGDGPDRDRWTAALAVARSILGLPDPNQAVTE
jgi:hypothetical protein